MSASLLVLATTAAVQAVVFVASGSVALLADLVHNGGDALTAVPLGIAFWLRSRRGEQAAGYFVVLAIAASAVVAAVEAIVRLAHPTRLTHLSVLVIAGVVGFAGNEIAARIRLGAGRRLGSAALVADGAHARTDGIVSLGVVVSALAAWRGWHVVDPIVGLVMTATILRVTWQSWRQVRSARPT